jgi:putative transposase
MKKASVTVVPTADAPISFKGYRFAPDIISYAVWLYYARSRYRFLTRAAPGSQRNAPGNRESSARASQKRRCSISSNRPLTWATGNEAGKHCYGGLKGDFGKGRPALVVQSDLFAGHPSVSVLLVSSRPRTIGFARRKSSRRRLRSGFEAKQSEQNQGVKKPQLAQDHPHVVAGAARPC